MTILVTGGAGYIGSHLFERLLKDGHQVDVIDDLSTGQIGKIHHCLRNNNFSFVNDMILNEKMMYTLIHKADTIYHLAATASVKLIVEEPVRTIETNIGATYEVSIEDLALMIKDMSESASQINYVPYEEAYGHAFDDMWRRVLSVEK
ncbi:MAG: GDP-mannose 4,6-dehydratase [Candidatus Hodarchaeales archaeon]|jgi:UDP-glucose 4-epimerase